jgi:branched-chain amino acid transport system ATP-binding protein
VGALLEAKGVDVGYGRIQVLKDVSLEIPSGAIVLLLGGNGAGKTTLLKTLSGLLRPSAGSISFAGSAIAGDSPRAIVRQGLLHVAEGRALFRSQRVDSNLDLGLYGTGLTRAEEKNRFERVYSLFPVLSERRTSLAGALSGGQQQMLAIGQALMQRPRLLMLDEPSLGLAPIIIDQVLDVVVRLRKDGTTILLVEQMVERALAIADYGYVLKTGRMVGQGDARTLASSETLKLAYMGGGA